jgi:hypothetical protein
VFVSGWNFYTFRLAAMLSPIVARLTPKSNKAQRENASDFMLRCSETIAREPAERKSPVAPGLLMQIMPFDHSLIVVVL